MLKINQAIQSEEEHDYEFLLYDALFDRFENDYSIPTKNPTESFETLEQLNDAIKLESLTPGRFIILAVQNGSIIFESGLGIFADNLVYLRGAFDQKRANPIRLHPALNGLFSVEGVVDFQLEEAFNFQLDANFRFAKAQGLL
jgi:hypothetical protein